MTKLRRVFALTKSEQRVVILIVVILVAIAFTKRHYQQHPSPQPLASPTTQRPGIVRPERSPQSGDRH
jgi:hypothetical protein